MRALAATLFLAVCAYAGAWLFGGLDKGPKLYRTVQYTVRESTALQGIAIRSEEGLFPAGEGEFTAFSGEKLPAGGVLGCFGGEMLLAPRAAVFYADSDGLEYIGPEMLEGLDSLRLQSLLELEEKHRRAEGRLIYEHVWYFAAFAGNGRLPEEGESCRVLFEGSAVSVDAVAERVLTEENGKSIVLLRFDRGGDELLSLRKSAAELIFSEYSGLRLPLEALCSDSQGNYFVYTHTAGLKERAEVDIIYWGEDFCLAAVSQEPGGLYPGGTVIVSP